MAKTKTDDSVVNTDVAKMATVEYAADTKQQKIILPQNMTLLDGAKELVRQHEDLEQEQAYTLNLPEYSVEEGLHAIFRIMNTNFGWIQGRHTMFSSPTEHSITTGFENGVAIKETLFTGPMTIGAYDDAKSQIGVNGSGAFMVINAKKKYGDQIRAFFKMITEFLKTSSLYRGKAVAATMVNDQLSTSIIEVNENTNIVLNQRARRMIDRLIIPTIGSGRKDIFLFYGSYGNGKTETGLNVGVLGMKKNATFFYVKDSAALLPLLNRIHVYTPAVVFMEDLDEIGSGEERSEEINNILNTIDGVALKGKDVTIIFTSNHPKNINKALKRPGRLDTMVEFSNPEPDAVAEIVHRLTGMDKQVAFDEVVQLMPPNSTGAIIAEICQRALRYREDQSQPVTPEDFDIAAGSIQDQLSLMQEEKEAAIPTLDVAFKSLVTDTIGESLEAIMKKVEDLE